MRISQAIYGLPSIRRHEAAGPGRPSSDRAPASEGPNAPHAYPPARESGSGPELQEFLSLGDMLHEHFVAEVRQRDGDGDGRLNRREYGGSPGDFAALDRDRDGRIDADDLTREALARNETSRHLISGEWSPIYHALLHVRYPSDEALAAAVQDGARIVAQSNPVTAASAGDVVPDEDGYETVAATGPEAVLLNFLGEHPDLRALHARLQDLADRLGRNQRYSPVDRLA